MADRLEWQQETGCWHCRTPDGYTAVVRKVDNRLSGYLASVEAPGWLYTGSLQTAARAREWCRHIVARDRRAPLVRPELKGGING